MVCEESSRFYYTSVKLLVLLFTFSDLCAPAVSQCLSLSYNDVSHMGDLYCDSWIYHQHHIHAHCLGK